MRFVDTNVFVRLITGDDKAKQAACAALFQRLRDGAEQARTSESVVAEVVFVLRSPRHYAMARDDIRDSLSALLSVDGLILANRASLLRALDLFAQHTKLDFEDALTVAHLVREGETEPYSYDRGFDAIPTVTRIEP